MNLEEALPLLRTGKDIRRSTWPPNYSFYLDGGKVRVRENNNEPRTAIWFTPDILASDWESV